MSKPRSQRHLRRKLRGLWRRIAHAQFYGPVGRYLALGDLTNTYYRRIRKEQRP